MKAKLVLGIICAAVLLGGCDRKGPAEQLGEEVDEAVDTIKRGEESTATKVDDAIDDIREDLEED